MKCSTKSIWAAWQVLIVFIAFFISITTPSAQSISTTSVTVPGLCNSDSFHQVPNNINYFIGRRLLNTSSDPCSGNNWTLSLFEMNWSTNTLTYVRDIISLPVTLPSQSDTIQSTYDSTIVSYNGELWAAFECAGTGPHLGGATSSCLAPLSSTDYSVTTSRMTLAVGGIPWSSSSNGYSASVPKIFIFQGTPYLYWSVSHFTTGANGQLLSDTTTRGAMLTQEPSGARRLWINGSVGMASLSVDSNSNYEVLGVNASAPLSSNVADSFDVQVVNNEVILTSGVGGKGCTTPWSPVYGCYRLAIRASSTPLGTDIYNSSFLTSQSLPFNPQEYSKIITDPSGNKYVMGSYLSPTINGSVSPATTISTGMQRYPINLNLLQFSGVDSTPAAAPTTATNYLATTFDVLQQFVPSCNESTPIPNQNSGLCFSAVERYCQSQGYEVGGLLEENNGNNTIVSCVRSVNASELWVNISGLTNFQPQCTASNLITDVCASAIASYCQSAGYPAGGFGPQENAGSTVVIACMGTQVGSLVSSTFQALSAQQATCSASWTSSGVCYSAVNRVCQSQGFLSGYGIINHNGNAAQIGCFKANVPS